MVTSFPVLRLPSYPNCDCCWKSPRAHSYLPALPSSRHLYLIPRIVTQPQNPQPICVEGAPEMEAERICSMAHNYLETKLLLRFFPLHPKDEVLSTSPPNLLSKDLPVSGAQASSALAALATFCMLESGEQRADLDLEASHALQLLRGAGRGPSGSLRLYLCLWVAARFMLTY